MLESKKMQLVVLHFGFLYYKIDLLPSLTEVMFYKKIY
jgi:hypothetical protein